MNSSKRILAAMITGGGILLQSHLTLAACQCTTINLIPEGAYTIDYNIAACTNLSDPSCQPQTPNPLQKDCHGHAGSGQNRFCDIAQVNGYASFKVAGVDHRHSFTIPKSGAEVHCTGTAFNPSCTNHPYPSNTPRNSRSGIPISTEWEIIKRENRNSPS